MDIRSKANPVSLVATGFCIGWLLSGSGLSFLLFLIMLLLALIPYFDVIASLAASAMKSIDSEQGYEAGQEDDYRRTHRTK